MQSYWFCQKYENYSLFLCVAFMKWMIASVFGFHFRFFVVSSHSV